MSGKAHIAEGGAGASGSASQTELAGRESERCAALMAGDIDRLADMLAEDLVHIHLNGQSDGKAAYLDGARTKYRFHRLRRGPLNIRVYGDFAVMTGPLSQMIEVVATGETIDVSATTTQTWVRQDGRWLLNTCHNAAVPGAS